MHIFDNIYISESYLNSETFSSNDNLNTCGYNISRTDHSFANQRGGIYLYYKGSLLIRITNINYLQEFVLIYI